MDNDAKHHIVAAYQQLVEEGGSQAISVTQVACRAGVSRATFYYHFKDIYDLVEFREREYVDALFRNLPEDGNAWSSMVDVIIDLYETDTLHVFGDYAHLDRDILRKMNSRFIYDILKRCFEHDLGVCDGQDEEVEFFLVTLTYALIGIVESVLDHAIDAQPREYFKKLDKYMVVPFRERMAARFSPVA